MLSRQQTTNGTDQTAGDVPVALRLYCFHMAEDSLYNKSAII